MTALGYTQSREFTVTYWVLWGVLQSFVGLYMLCGGKLLLDLAFPEESEAEEEHPVETVKGG